MTAILSHDKIKKLTLEKGMFQDAKRDGITLSAILNKLDPSSNYKGKLATMDAFQRQLLAHKIQITGTHASLVQDFFSTHESSVLFPEFWNRNIQIGIDKARKIRLTLNDFVSATNTIDSQTYSGLSVDFDKTDLRMKRVLERTDFPTVKFAVKKKSINLVKVALLIESSYESIRRTKLNVMQNTIQVLGISFGDDIVYEGLDVLLNGDGNDNPAQVLNSETSGSLTYDDMVDLDQESNYHESDLYVGGKEAVKKLLKIPEFKDPLAGSEYALKGNVPNPLGNSIKRNLEFPDNKVMAVNKLAGVELIEEAGGSLVEVDRIINKQIEQTAISKWVGFNKIFSDSALVLDFGW